LVAARGVRESLGFAATLTAVEVGGLVMVIVAGFLAAPSADWQAPASVAEAVPGPLAAATILAFFAFIGFEDMVNMAEETREPARTVPRAILAALALTGLLYMLVAFAAVRAVPVAVLAASEQPLALVWQAGTAFGPGVLAAIAVAAALNGVLAQIVMAARVLLGIGRRVPAFSALAAIDARFGTPVRATLLIGVALILGALLLPVATLAGITSGLLLLVFTAVNLALLRLKGRTPRPAFSVPVWVPALGAALSVGALGAAMWGVG
ncbi:MAG: amino acid permease, partial [Alphaproteobacteria bacterium]